MKKLICIICALMAIVSVQAKSYDNPDTLFVARDGTCEFRNIADAIEVCRAFMEYHKVIYVKKGTYKELTNLLKEVYDLEIKYVGQTLFKAFTLNKIRDISSQILRIVEKFNNSVNYR